MHHSEKVFWGLVGISAVYITFNFATSTKVSAQASQQAVAAQSATQGMGCMAKGGGCGCGGMMKKTQ